MNTQSCRVAFPAQAFTAYWLGELDDPTQAGLEEHLFACPACTERLNALAQLSAGVRQLTRDGDISAILPTSFVKRLQESGVRVREYRVHAGGSVMCTVTPEDDLVLAHLHAPLQHVQRLDVVLHDDTNGARVRIDDVPFDPSGDEIVMLPNVAQLRQVEQLTLRVQLLAVDPARERVLGEYTFNHSRQR